MDLHSNAMHHISRRELIGRAAVITGAALVTGPELKAQAASEGTKANAPFRFCLNTATIRGQKLGIVKEIQVAGQAGYDAIEPWVSSIEEYTKAGGSLRELKQQITDAGLTVESAIAFPEWIVDDESRRAKGMEQAKREMDMVAQIGGKRFAAPPAGANNPGLDPFKVADRYRALLEAGDQLGVIPQFELWGFSKNFHLLSECAMIAIQTGHPKACVLTDMFHLYKGGSDYHGLKLLSRTALQVFHMNDYPLDPPREKINDGYRIFPGDGAAPLVEVLRLLHGTGGQPVLSLELFNNRYWAQDALITAKEGLAKMKAVAEKARS